MPGLTRRQALFGLAAVAAATGTGLYGQYAVGDEFEAHVASQLGVDLDFARRTLRSLRARVGVDYDARAASFVLATTEPSRTLMPRSAREEAIAALIVPMFSLAPSPGSPLYYAGLRPDSRLRPCRMLSQRGASPSMI